LPEIPDIGSAKAGQKKSRGAVTETSPRPTA